MINSIFLFFLLGNFLPDFNILENNYFFEICCGEFDFSEGQDGAENV